MYAAWDDSSDLKQTLVILRDLALTFTREGGARGQEIAALINAGDYKALVEYTIDYTEDWDVFQLAACRQALAFYTKLEALEIGVDKSHEALKTFLDGEARCSATNDLFRAVNRGTATFVPGLALLLDRARRKIQRTLGAAPMFSELKLKFGPGATTAIKRQDANPSNKMGSGIQCSSDLLYSGYLPSLLREIPHWTSSLPSTYYSVDDDGWLIEHVDVAIHAGVLEFVPKNARTYRSILVEPALNGILQGGIGRVIRRCLKRAGIDIRDQGINKNLARQGSITGLLATLDLSNASDTIAYELVRHLLPGDWFELLCAARSGSYSLGKGKEERFQKFSSMGNGFTFPLETLIFWSLTAAACEGMASSVSAYGDDIICPASRVGDVICGLTWCGFEVNSKKSYWDGPFRESCGGDYYRGFDIRPYYQKDLVGPVTLYVLHNHFVRNMDEERAAQVRGLIPNELQLYGPDGYGDGVLIHANGEAHLNRSRSMRAAGFGQSAAFEAFVRIPVKQVTRYPGDYVSPLYSVYVRPRDDSPSVTKYHPSYKIPYEFWANTVNWARNIDAIPKTDVHPSGRCYWPLPGYQGYKKVRIYTLG